jgi:uridine kinase
MSKKEYTIGIMGRKWAGKSTLAKELDGVNERVNGRVVIDTKADYTTQEYDLKIYVECSADTALARGIRRDGLCAMDSVIEPPSSYNVMISSDIIVLNNKEGKINKIAIDLILGYICAVMA